MSMWWTVKLVKSASESESMDTDKTNDRVIDLELEGDFERGRGYNSDYWGESYSSYAYQFPPYFCDTYTRSQFHIPERDSKSSFELQVSLHLLACGVDYPCS